MMITDERIIELRKQTYGGLTPWAETLAFARALEKELREKFAEGPDYTGHSHMCRACMHRYTPDGQDEDCPACGSNGIL